MSRFFSVKKIFLVFFSLGTFCVSLTSLELLLRIFPQLINEEIFYKKELLWDNLNDPNYPGALEYFNQRYKYNKVLGYTSEKNNLIETENEIKNFSIAFLGDSVTEYGYFISPLSSRNCFEKIELKNFGVTGYGTQQELQLLRSTVLKTDPEIVVLQIHTNDLKTTPVFIPTQKGWIGFYSPMKWFNPDLYEKFQLYKLTSIQILKLTSVQKTQQDNLMNIETPLTEIINILNQHSIPYVIIAFPNFEDNDYQTDLIEIDQVIKDLHQEKHYLNLSQAFTDFSFQDVSIDQGHPNEKGGKIALEILAKKLLPIIESHPELNTLSDYCSSELK